jgi:uncharacterized ion transporter superfamily protein YfcC
MEATEKAGAQISTKAFVQSVLILFVLMMLAGVLTHVVPAGSYAIVIFLAVAVALGYGPF